MAPKNRSVHRFLRSKYELTDALSLNPPGSTIGHPSTGGSQQRHQPPGLHQLLQSPRKPGIPNIISNSNNVNNQPMPQPGPAGIMSVGPHGVLHPHQMIPAMLQAQQPNMVMPPQTGTAQLLMPPPYSNVNNGPIAAPMLPPHQLQQMLQAPNQPRFSPPTSPLYTAPVATLPEDTVYQKFLKAMPAATPIQPPPGIPPDLYLIPFDFHSAYNGDWWMRENQIQVQPMTRVWKGAANMLDIKGYDFREARNKQTALWAKSKAASAAEEGLMNVGQALRIFAEVEGLAPIFELYVHRGVYFYNEEDFDNAKADFDKALSMAEDDMQRWDVRFLLRSCREHKTPIEKLQYVPGMATATKPKAEPSKPKALATHFSSNHHKRARSRSIERHDRDAKRPRDRSRESIKSNDTKSESNLEPNPEPSLTTYNRTSRSDTTGNDHQHHPRSIHRCKSSSSSSEHDTWSSKNQRDKIDTEYYSRSEKEYREDPDHYIKGEKEYREDPDHYIKGENEYREDPDHYSKGEREYREASDRQSKSEREYRDDSDSKGEKEYREDPDRYSKGEKEYRDDSDSKGEKEYREDPDHYSKGGKEYRRTSVCSQGDADGVDGHEIDEVMSETRRGEYRRAGGSARTRADRHQRNSVDDYNYHRNSRNHYRDRDYSRGRDDYVRYRDADYPSRRYSHSYKDVDYDRRGRDDDYYRPRSRDTYKGSYRDDYSGQDDSSSSRNYNSNRDSSRHDTYKPSGGHRDSYRSRSSYDDHETSGGRTRSSYRRRDSYPDDYDTPSHSYKDYDRRDSDREHRSSVPTQRPYDDYGSSRRDNRRR
ncbi:hypothetical protein SeMB42_g04900 [Synchytrium endobioticum]|uniref:Uncharacterized protein n=1 Tax=Synchytrium endobioticum TaxID=286115 RepID=A0A507CUY3_9FUNG|nr:hypothetical protein SeMB42_g04900 [Synchytrium endobioticum]TPX44675.1 hypothetical protein SeLEV6574_g04353 [Synchytrium endobioticum]